MFKGTKTLALVGFSVLISGVVFAQTRSGEDAASAIWEQRQKWEGKSEKKAGGPMGAMGESGSTVKGSTTTYKSKDYGVRSSNTVTTSRSLPPELAPAGTPRRYGMFLAADDATCYAVYFKDGDSMNAENARYAEVSVPANFCNTNYVVNDNDLRNAAYDYISKQKTSGKVKKIVGDNEELVSSAEDKGYTGLHTGPNGMTHMAKFVPGRNGAENKVEVGQVMGVMDPTKGPVSDLPAKTRTVGELVAVDHKPTFIQTPEQIAAGRADTQPAAPIIDKSVYLDGNAAGKPTQPAKPAEEKLKLNPMQPMGPYQPVPYAKMDTVHLDEVKEKKTEDGKTVSCVGGPKLKDGILYDIKHLTQDLCDKMANEDFDRYCMLPKHCNFSNKDCDVDTCIEQYRKMKGRAVEAEYKKYDDAQDAFLKALNSERRAKIAHTKCVAENPKAVCEKKHTASKLAAAGKALKAARAARDQANKDMEASVKVKLEDKSGEYATSCMDSKSFESFYPKFRQTLLVYQCKKGPFGTKPEDQKYKNQTPAEIKK